MLDAFSLTLPGVAGPDRNGRFAALADDAADVLACTGSLWIAENLR
jgi:hypothetical protein